MQQDSQTSKVALITGGARRIGAGIASALHQQGMRIILHYRSSAGAAEQLGERLNARRQDSVVLVQGDLGRFDDLAPALIAAVEAQGGLDILVHNASEFFATPVGGATEAQWEQLMNVHAKAPFFLSQCLADALRRRRGCIVNITDIYAERPLRDHTIYCASKAALLALTRSLAVDLAPDVRVNAVAPGAILWPEGDQDHEARRQILAATPLARLGCPEDIARAVLYLACSAEFVTGQVIAVDGGRSVPG